MRETQRSYLASNSARAVLIFAVALLFVAVPVYFLFVSHDWLQRRFPTLFPYRKTLFAIAALVLYAVLTTLSKYSTARYRARHDPPAGRDRSA